MEALGEISQRGDPYKVDMQFLISTYTAEAPNAYVYRL